MGGLRSPQPFRVRQIWFETQSYTETKSLENNHRLVGGIPTPLKNMSSSVGMMKFPTEWNVIQFHGSSHHQAVNISSSHADRWVKLEMGFLVGTGWPGWSKMCSTERVSANGKSLNHKVRPFFGKVLLLFWWDFDNIGFSANMRNEGSLKLSYRRQNAHSMRPCARRMCGLTETQK
jgi:hypothetical protein